jgi:hypothetical protein
MGGSLITHMKGEKNANGLLLNNMKGRDHSEDLGVDGGII